MRGSLPDARRARVQASKCCSQAVDGILGTDTLIRLADALDANLELVARTSP